MRITNHFGYKTAVSLQKITLILVSPIIFISALFWLVTVQATKAEAVNCANDQWQVTTEQALNEAIACYNAKTSAGNYTIELTQDIALITSTTSINNTVSGIDLLVEGNEFTVDGQDIYGLRPFHIMTNTTATFQHITLTGGNKTEPSNGGGAILNEGFLFVYYSTFEGNSATFGGGIKNLTNALLTVGNSTFRNNYSVLSGGGIYNNYGSVIVTNSTFNDNIAESSGGGIYGTDELTVSNSTISNNSAYGGGGIFADGSTTIINSTISDNSGDFGGGVFNPYGTLTINNSIIANSTVGDDCLNWDTVIDQGHNIIEDNSCAFIGGSDPMLGPLQDNGGATFTHALLPNSPAIDTGNTLLTMDQRGVTRPQRIADDIGAVEMEQEVIVEPSLNSIFVPLVLKR